MFISVTNNNLYCKITEISRPEYKTVINSRIYNILYEQMHCYDLETNQ